MPAPYRGAEELFDALQRQWGVAVWSNRVRGWTTKLFNTYWRMRAKPLQCHATTAPEIAELLHHLDLSSVKSLLDPFCGSYAIGDGIRDALHPDARVFNNDLRAECCRSGTTHEDALLPPFYARFAREHGAPDAVVTSPPFAVTDLVLVQLLQSAGKVVALHALDSYRGALHRQAYFKPLNAQGRIHVIEGMRNVSDDGSSRRCSWIIVFRTPEDVTCMLRERRGFC